MNKINWKIRLRNKAFWLGAIPAALLLARSAAGVFGISLELDWLGERLLELVNALFALLAALGVVTDPTTEGLGDSERALAYTAPAAQQ